jgi:hypothetical protein
MLGKSACENGLSGTPTMNISGTPATNIGLLGMPVTGLHRIRYVHFE